MLTFHRKIYKGENRRVYEGSYGGQRCCIKVLTSTNAHQRELFFEEYRILSHISHPKLPKAIAFEETDLGPAMILSFLEGQTLRELLVSNKTSKLSFEKLYIQLTKLIQDIHRLKSTKDKKALNIIHRDLKPSNIIIHLPSEEVFICDLGIAYYEHPDRSMKSSPAQRKGSILYCAPEYLLEASKGPKQDYFSLGWIFIEFLTNKKPPGFIPNAQKYNEIRKEYIDGIPQQYQRSCKMLTEFHPQDRQIIPLLENVPQKRLSTSIIVLIIIGIAFFLTFLLTNTTTVR